MKAKIVIVDGILEGVFLDEEAQTANLELDIVDADSDCDPNDAVYHELSNPDMKTAEISVRRPEATAGTSVDKPVIITNEKKPDITVLRKPYTVPEIRSLCDENNYITGCVSVPLKDIIDCDFEQFLDLLERRLVNDGCLMDIRYDAVGIKGAGSEDTCIILKVTGDASDIPDMDPEEETEERKNA